MDLQEFISETISAIVDATEKLQDDYKDASVVISPPAALSGSDVYMDGSGNYVYRHVKDIDFDVAVTIGSDAEGTGKAGIKVFSFEAGVGGKVAKTSEQVSRVQFSIPIAMTNKHSEQKNKEARKAQKAIEKEAKRREEESLQEANS